MPSITRLFRHLLILFLQFFFNRVVVFKIIGYFNRQWRFLETVFVAYPASIEYVSAYASLRYVEQTKWKPWLTGLFYQNGKWGLMLSVSSMESDFLNPNNKSNLQALVNHVECVRELLGAPQKLLQVFCRGFC